MEKKCRFKAKNFFSLSAPKIPIDTNVKSVTLLGLFLTNDSYHVSWGMARSIRKGLTNPTLVCFFKSVHPLKRY